MNEQEPEMGLAQSFSMSLLVTSAEQWGLFFFLLSMLVIDYHSMTRSVSKFQPMHVSIICLSSFLSFKSVVSDHCRLLKHKLVLLTSVLRKC